MIASAARTLVDGGVLGSTITLPNVETAAPDLVQLRDRLTFGRSARESDPLLTSKTSPNRVNVRNVALSGYRHRAFARYPFSLGSIRNGRSGPTYPCYQLNIG
jgi:hypothetical protein